MISIYTKELDSKWFGVAYIGEKILTTAVGSARRSVLRNLLNGIPSGVEYRIEKASDFGEKTILMLSELNSGNEDLKDFELAEVYLPEVAAKVLRIAAAIPLGYVTSYGNIAKAANADPIEVGRIMATNPLYPIVPCHRVVGADFSLVGYGGRRSRQALEAKLVRLNRERRGLTAEKEVSVSGKKLLVYPVESVIKKARRLGMDPSQKRLI